MSKMTPRLLPIGWEYYWGLRVNSHRPTGEWQLYSILEAKAEMVERGYSEFYELLPSTLRQLELYTITNIACECEWCLMGYNENEGLDHRIPVEILKAEHYNWQTLEDMQDTQ